MRRKSAILLAIIALLLTVSIAGCGAASDTDQAAGDGSPESILAAAVAASETMTGAAGTFDLTLSFEADTSEMPADSMSFLAEPMTLSGTFAYSDEPRAGEFNMALSMGEETMNVGIRLLENKLWLALLDQWYEAPPEMEQTLAESSDQQAKLNDLKALLEELGIDPMTWFTDLTLAGEENLDDETVYHLAGSLDATKMMADVVKLMGNEKFMELVDPTGSMSGSMGMEGLVPAADDLEEIQTELAQVFDEFTIELWIAKDDFALRKATMNLRVTPPAGEESMGMTAMTMNAVISLQDVDDSVNVEAPASSLPFSDLEKAIEENPALFLGPFSGLLGGMGSGTSGSY